MLLYKHIQSEDWSALVDEAIQIASIYGNVDMDTHAREVLVRTRQITVANGLGDLTRRVESGLLELD